MPEVTHALHGSLLLVGIGGYGGTYLEALWPAWQAGGLQVAGVVDPFADRAPRWPELAARGVPRFDTLAEAAAAGVQADLAVIASPIALHAEQTCAALAMGMAVLCEKPIAATVQEADRMAAARDRAGRFVAIGYQWSFSAAIRDLKADVLAGRLGAPRCLSTGVAWPRDSAYYQRNRWAGRLRDDQGRWVLDSPVNNATAHYLHNMLYVIGPAPDRSAQPIEVTGELYRANPIENCDAACARIRTDTGAELRFFSAHCVATGWGPHFAYEFDDVVVHFAGHGSIVATFRSGGTRDYGTPDGGSATKLGHCLAAARGEGAAPPCGIEAARCHTLVVNGLQETGVHAVPPDWILRTPSGTAGATLTHVRGLDTAVQTGHATGRLFSEQGLPWTAPARSIDLRGYTAYPRAAAAGRDV